MYRSHLLIVLSLHWANKYQRMNEWINEYQKFVPLYVAQIYERSHHYWLLLLLEALGLLRPQFHSNKVRPHCHWEQKRSTNWLCAVCNWSSQYQSRKRSRNPTVRTKYVRTTKRSYRVRRDVPRPCDVEVGGSLEYWSALGDCQAAFHQQNSMQHVLYRTSIPIGPRVLPEANQ